MYDTIIIGAGMSGLAAGIRLAYYEQRVCILERHTTIGGLNSFYRLNRRDYDVGLHAVTNFTGPQTKRGPWHRILRQLRFRWEEFALAPQRGSRIAFPEVTLRFNNHPEKLASEVARAFPDQRDGFARLCDAIVDYDHLTQDMFQQSARDHLQTYLRDPLLTEMLLCPLMWYGNPREDDMTWGSFCIMFRSIFFEGFGRPFKGVRLILSNLVKRFRSLGGELMLRRGVNRILLDQGRAVGVELDNGQQLFGQRILSSAGHVETLRLCQSESPLESVAPGQMSFVETMSVLDRQPQEIGFDDTIVFFNDSEHFHWRRPEHGLCDARTGVICSPNNYLYGPGEGELPEGLIRITAIASFDRWRELDEPAYRREKLRWYDQTAAAAARFMPDFRPYVIDTDMFTPTTIYRYTWHDNGAVYGAPDKRLDGTTAVPNLFICGTDQGFIGIVGALLSGIAMANRHCLKD
ncbi:MAG TPA: NAD(P)/FAD-dependent oxidoreductase [Pirellulaceae bacterium]|nr:NAD(P)/FAD-dependent oxidoreductase [Pirellulaceae bacterium]